MSEVDPGRFKPQDIRKPVAGLAGHHPAARRQFGGWALLNKRDRALPSVGEILLGQKRIIAGWSGEFGGLGRHCGRIAESRCWIDCP
jgi:hypothetical protein